MVNKERQFQSVVKGKNIDVTPGLRSAVDRGVVKLGKFFEDTKSVSVDVVLSTQRSRGIVEVTIQVDGLLLRAEAESEDMYNAIDDAVERLDRQIRKYKSKIHRRLQDGPKLSEVAPAPQRGERADNGKASLSDEPDGPRVVRTKRFAIKPMSVDEAAMQMELLGHDFFVFSNAETDQVNVVYKRKDGNVGLIEPDF